MRICSIGLLALLVALVAPAQAQGETDALPSTESSSGFVEASLREARTIEVGEARVAALVNRWTGTAEWVSEPDGLVTDDLRRGAIPTASDARSFARAVLGRHGEALGLPPAWEAGLGDPVVRQRRSFWTVDFVQEADGVGVSSSYVGLTVGFDGTLIALGVRVFPDAPSDVTPAIGAAAAYVAARDYVAGLPPADGLPLAPSADLVGQELVVLPLLGDGAYAYALAWALDLEGAGRAYVDARDGGVLRFDPAPSAHAHAAAPAAPLMPVALGGAPPSGPAERAAPAAVVPSGDSVYGYVTLNHYETPNDYTQPLERYTNAPFAGAKVELTPQGGGATTTAFADANGFYSINGIAAGVYTITFSIETPYVRVNSGYSPTSFSTTVSVSGAVRCDHAWGWGPDGDGGTSAQALNGVYGIDAMARYFSSRYGQTLNTLPQALNVSTSNTGYATGGSITLGRLAATSTEVAYHELSHNAIYSAYGNTWISTGSPIYGEGRAMDEGLADFFSTDHTDDYTYGGPGSGAEPTFPNEFIGIRFLYNACTMNDFNIAQACSHGGSTSSHRRGLILNGALWKLRVVIGTAAMDLTYDAMTASPQPRTFTDLRLKMEAVDQAQNGGANLVAIEDQFVRRYIGGPRVPTFIGWNMNAPPFPTVTWTDLSAIESGYHVERRLQGTTPWTRIATVGPNVTSYRDLDLKCGVGSDVYNYRIVGFYTNPGGPDAERESWSSFPYDRSSCGGSFRVASGEGPETGPAPLAAARGEAVETGVQSVAPNPSAASPRLRFGLAEATAVTVRVFDVIGREVYESALEPLEPGVHTVALGRGALPAGVYLGVFEAGAHRETVRFTIVK